MFRMLGSRLLILPAHRKTGADRRVRPGILAKPDRGWDYLASMMKVGAIPAELENPLPLET
jgi:hypothetical protein